MKKPSHIHSKAENITKSGMFKVPEGYFEQLTERVMKNVTSVPDESLKGKIIPYSPRRILLVAASVAGFIILSFAGYHTLHHSHNKSLLSQSDAYEMAAYYSGDFEENLLMMNMQDEEPITNTESDAMINYLVDEGIDELTLLQAY